MSFAQTLGRIANATVESIARKQAADAPVKRKAKKDSCGSCSAIANVAKAREKLGFKGA